MKKGIHKLTVLFTLFFAISFAQKSKELKALKNYDNFSYSNSKEQLLDLLKKDGSSATLIQKLANAYYFNNEMTEASEWYGKLISKQPNTEPENYFRLAQSLRAQEKYNEANLMLKKFAELKPEDSRSKSYLKATDYIDHIENNEERVTLKNLDINTNFSDFGTSTYSGNLIFASSRDETEMIYTWNNQPFLDLFQLNASGKVEELLGDINTKYHESSTSFTKDGNTAYFTRTNFFNKKLNKTSEDIHGLKIYRATLVEGSWTNIEPLPFNSDEYHVAHPALSFDEKTLYFSSDMPGGFGLSDIYKVSINDDGSYGTPENLGPSLNTEGRDNFPFVSDKDVLYFSSDGHLGLGGLDVFKVEKNIVKGKESKVIKNIGKPFNSPKDDFGFIINEKQGKGYITSNRSGGKGDDDIYSMIIAPCTNEIKGIVIDSKTKDPISGAEVTIYNDQKDALESFTTDASGNFEITLPCENNDYTAEGKKDTYNDGITSFKTTVKQSDVEVELALTKSGPDVELGQDLFTLLNLNPIYFDYDKAFIRPDAEVELTKIINYLKENPTVKVDVRSHTDSRGRDSYNFALSNRRNTSTKDYIIYVGDIAKDRISGAGYGETDLVNQCSNGVKCSDEEHQANRRSEFIVVAK